MVTVLEIREQSGRMKRVGIVREKSENLRKRKKVREFDRLSEHESFTTTQVQLDDINFCQDGLSRSHEKLSYVREKLGKVREKKIEKNMAALSANKIGLPLCYLCIV